MGKSVRIFNSKIDVSYKKRLCSPGAINGSESAFVSAYETMPPFRQGVKHSSDLSQKRQMMPKDQITTLTMQNQPGNILSFQADFQFFLI